MKTPNFISRLSSPSKVLLLWAALYLVFRLFQLSGVLNDADSAVSIFFSTGFLAWYLVAGDQFFSRRQRDYIGAACFGLMAMSFFEGSHESLIVRGIGVGICVFLSITLLWPRREIRHDE